MFVCTLDFRSTSLRLVLTFNDKVPLFLEGRLFRRPVDPTCVLAILQEWESLYRAPLDLLVGCLQDPWPPGLEEILRQAGYRLQWVDIEDVELLVDFWKHHSPDPRWLRGGLMGFLRSSPAMYPPVDGVFEKAALEWRYAALRARLEEMEAEMFGECRRICPGHLSPECPDCEPIPERFLPRDPWMEEDEPAWEAPGGMGSSEDSSVPVPAGRNAD
jgi:hypothetical protein